MISEKSLQAAKEAYDIEAECIRTMKDYLDEESFSKAVELLSGATRIGAAGCGHSGIICQHFAHLMCCIERPARFISPAEAVHGATGFLQKGDVMVLASRGGATKELFPILDICKAKGVTVITVDDDAHTILPTNSAEDGLKWTWDAENGYFYVTFSAEEIAAMDAAIAEKKAEFAENYAIVNDLAR